MVPKKFLGAQKNFVENPKKSLEFRKIAIKIATELRSRRKNTPEKAETMENLTAIPKMREIFIIRTIFHFAKPKKKSAKKIFGVFFGRKMPPKKIWTI